VSWRTVCITKRCKLEYRMGYLVIRDDEIQRIHMDEIALLMVENTAISLTASLLNEMNKKKVKVIFCDEQHNPSFELVSYHGSHNSSKCIRDQIAWESETKAAIWQMIIRDKITNQANVLKAHELNGESDLLNNYVNQIEPGDVSNREGHAAKVYFNALFGKNFSRDKACLINAMLDYGYSLLLASFNREVHALGRLTQLGIWHDNTFNFFNLSSDLMEAFRPLIDRYVLSEFDDLSSEEQLSKDHKHALLKVFECNVVVNDSSYKLPNAIRIYTQKIIQSLDESTLDYMPMMTYG
jgi:CRISP-associated protein Cas1